MRDNAGIIKKGDNVKKLIKAMVILVIAFSLNGCIVAAIGAGVAAVKYANSKKSEAQAKNKQSYNEYALGMQRINIEREKKGLRPEPILTPERYNSSQAYN
jgi:hypothetical protein